MAKSPSGESHCTFNKKHEKTVKNSHFRQNPLARRPIKTHFSQFSTKPLHSGHHFGHILTTFWTENVEDPRGNRVEKWSKSGRKVVVF